VQISISSVVVNERVRKDIGDLAQLMESMQTHGQFSPIIITRKNELIVGHRRLLAAKRLGWYTIDAVCVDRDSDVEKLEMELAENVHRKDFSPEEILAGFSRLERLKKPGFFARIRSFFRRIFQRIFRRNPSERGESAQDRHSSQASQDDDGALHPDTAASL